MRAPGARGVLGARAGSRQVPLAHSRADEHRDDVTLEFRLVSVPRKQLRLWLFRPQVRDAIQNVVVAAGDNRKVEIRGFGSA